MRTHLDFCGGGEFCSLDDCLCECHFVSAPPPDDSWRFSDTCCQGLSVLIHAPDCVTRSSVTLK